MMMHHRRHMLMTSEKAITMMGVSYNTASNSTVLTRLGAAVGKSAVAGIGATPQVSDFDNMPIYRDIRLCNLAANGTVNAYYGDPGFTRDGSNGEVMVEIPKFWYKTTLGTVEEWWVADGPASGFSVFPAFARGGAYADLKYNYISAYNVGAGYASVSGIAPITNMTRAEARTGASGKGARWSQVDIALMMAVRLLMYIEYANLDIQTAIGPGRCSIPGIIDNGGSDNMAGHTGRAAGVATEVAVKWRHIENWWSNVWNWVDGLNIYNGTPYFALNPAVFADGVSTNYTYAGYDLPTNVSATYIKTMGSNTWLRLPTAGGATATTYYCDALWGATGWPTVRFGGGTGIGGDTVVGPAMLAFNATTFDAGTGARTQYLPPSA